MLELYVNHGDSKSLLSSDQLEKLDMFISKNLSLTTLTITANHHHHCPSLFLVVNSCLLRLIKRNDYQLRAIVLNDACWSSYRFRTKSASQIDSSNDEKGYDFMKWADTRDDLPSFFFIIRHAAHSC